MKRVLRIVCVAAICTLTAACAATAPTYRTTPQLDRKLQDAKSITLLPLKIDVFQVSAGGVIEKMDAWSGQAERNVMSAVEDSLANKPLLNLKTFNATLLSEEERINFEETAALFDAVSASILLHTYGPPEHRFPDKIAHFDYTLGAEVGKLADGGDALLLVSGIDHISTAGRKALQAGTMILGALVGVVVAPQGGLTALRIALVDADTGELLWFNWHGSAGDHDFRNPVNTRELVMSLLEGFPL
jgi:hypothetical protein